ncbi:hypothetical protein [Falsirhodobacter halotolerans]|uniref:hypothetical protein n=1 Tax=Falsirhodobacter halotolerans TaxID=1146892 RepID=UPI001FD0532B|nr:hypothetical protein [Falsirhodobacter halotolerans]MCJ8140849.1 hypothetical protein [Falsirhodobacter halotolerans]
MTHALIVATPSAPRGASRMTVRARPAPMADIVGGAGALAGVDIERGNALALANVLETPRLNAGTQ